MKKLFSFVLALCILLSGTALAATVENRAVESYISDGTTYAEVSSLAEALGLYYAEKDGRISLTDNVTSPSALVFDMNNPFSVTVMSYEGKQGELKLIKSAEQALIMPIQVTESRVFVPIRYVSEFFGARVYYSEGETRVERASYGKATLIRTNGTVRERVLMPEGFESAVIIGDELLYISGGSIYKRSLYEEGADEYLCPAGRTHPVGDRLFVFSAGSVNVVEIATGKSQKIADKVTMVGYTYDDYIWCETEKDITVYDVYANKIAKITGKFYNAFEYAGGRVFYTDSSDKLYSAKPDGTDVRVLAKVAYYPDYYDGFVYYTDLAGNYRRVNAETGEDIMIYGLNLEKLSVLSGKFILNYYSQEGKHRLFVSNPDGTEFRPYSAAGIAAAAVPLNYLDGLLVTSLTDGKPYYVTEDKAVLLSDDEPSLVAGAHGEWAYYVII